MDREQVFKNLKMAFHEKCAIFLMIIIPLLFVRQGLDFTDTGYLLTNYQQIFNDPSSIESSFRIWLTDIIGGVWVWFFGDSLGVLGYRLAGILLNYGVIYLSYLLLYRYIPRKYLIWGLFLSLIFINRSGYQLNYNVLTAFFYVLSAYFIVRGLETDKNHLVFFSGFTLGLNIFVRLPNLLGFFLVICIFFAGSLHKTPVPVQIKRAVWFCVGYLLSILAVLLTMRLLGHFEAYVLALESSLQMLQDPLGHHSSSRLIDIIVYLYKTAVMKIILMIIVLFAVSVIFTVLAKTGIKVLSLLLILILTSAWFLNYRDIYLDWYAMVSSVLGVLVVILIMNAFFYRAGNKAFRTAAFASLIILLITPVGSADGIYNSVWGMYLAITIAFSYIMRLREFKVDFRPITERLPLTCSIRLSREETWLIKMLAIALFAVFTLASAYSFTYRDSGNRGDMLYGIENGKLTGVLTTRDRARVVKELLQVLSGYVRENDYLLAYEQISLVYFLTDTRPYLYSAWPMLYSPEEFAKSLQRAQKNRPYLPVIVRAKGNTEEAGWPNTKGLREDGYYLSGCRRIMNDFVRDKHYQSVWQNDFFEILLPPPDS